MARRSATPKWRASNGRRTRRRSGGPPDLVSQGAGDPEIGSSAHELHVVLVGEALDADRFVLGKILVASREGDPVRIATHRPKQFDLAVVVLPPVFDYLLRKCEGCGGFAGGDGPGADEGNHVFS